MRRSFVGALVVAASTLLLVMIAGPAAAHTDTGTFSATRAEPAADGTYTIDLLLTYDNDGHGAEDAALTVTVQGPSGSPTPVAMAPGDRAGAYTGEVAADAVGDYTVTASATDPEAQTTFTFTVAAPATTTTAAESTTTTAADPEATTTTAADRDGTDGEGDEDGNLASIVVNGLLLIAGAAGAFFAIRWWRNRRGGASAS